MHFCVATPKHFSVFGISKLKSAHPTDEKKHANQIALSVSFDENFTQNSIYFVRRRLFRLRQIFFAVFECIKNVTLTILRRSFFWWIFKLPRNRMFAFTLEFCKVFFFCKTCFWLPRAWGDHRILFFAKKKTDVGFLFISLATFGGSKNEPRRKQRC